MLPELVVVSVVVGVLVSALEVSVALVGGTR